MLMSKVEVEVLSAPLLATYCLMSADVRKSIGEKRGMLLVSGHSFFVCARSVHVSFGYLDGRESFDDANLVLKI